MKDTAEMGNNQAVDNNNLGSRGSRALESYDELVELGNNQLKGDRTLSPVSTARTSPASACAPTKSQLCQQIIDTDQDWEVRGIIGREDIDGVLHYMVDWHPTLLPEHYTLWDIQRRW
ncbi:uncharacterized protein LY89DRAFT_436873 [Mollisia scopiformis]|uniref:Uncharacterized protein n=1 Tax=Mollisia scopiformis TaxID=149040 RepID=A0A132B1P6_MOLSC|nr:uncharacterized protein LY89DRAFT_436873 [Mollisia scopiformis]KUJ06153.1 hypothetical protein LY89DRAFT_436873 [Mollisia scopiformis]